MIATNLLFYFLIVYLAWQCCDRIVRGSAFIQSVVVKSEKSSHTTLDGLRGFLAINVVFHHATFTYFYFQQDGHWKLPMSAHFHFAIGAEAVTMFFMMTAFLAWSSIIQRPKFDVLTFYLKRLVRVFPIHWLSLILVLLVMIVSSKFSLQSPSMMHVARSLDDWVTAQIGTLPLIFGRQQLPTINEFPAWMANAGVTWTLAYDLNFYLLLPLLANFVRLNWFIGLAIGVVALHRHFDLEQTSIMIKFLLGMSLAYVFQQYRWEKYLTHPIASIAIILALGLGWIIPIPPSLQLACMLFAFVGILYGNSLFGLLTNPAARYLGAISYSIYLLHGIILFVTFHSLNHWVPVKTLLPIGFWSITAICTMLVIIVAGLSYRYVEYPIMQRRYFSARSSEPSIINISPIAE
jgi:peptidoglycan/LPS O-acetylase OafA/YrhL